MTAVKLVIHLCMVKAVQLLIRPEFLERSNSLVVLITSNKKTIRKITKNSDAYCCVGQIWKFHWRGTVATRTQPVRRKHWDCCHERDSRTRSHNPSACSLPYIHSGCCSACYRHMRFSRPGDSFSPRTGPPPIEHRTLCLKSYIKDWKRSETRRKYSFI